MKNDKNKKKNDEKEKGYMYVWPLGLVNYVRENTKKFVILNCILNWHQQLLRQEKIIACSVL
jgi:hypothetical protein